jgi:hypothetical protein
MWIIYGRLEWQWFGWLFTQMKAQSGDGCHGIFPELLVLSALQVFVVITVGCPTQRTLRRIHNKQNVMSCYLKFHLCSTEDVALRFVKVENYRVRNLLWKFNVNYKL